MSSTTVYEGTYRAPRKVLCLDIETVSAWPALPIEVRMGYLRRHREAELRKPQEARGDAAEYPPNKASTSPWTGTIACIALYEPGAQKGFCLYRRPDGTVDEPLVEEHARFECHADERALLEAFWQIIARNPDARIDGFCSRNFDGHYLHTRSYIRGVPVTRNLTPYRYSTQEVLDLHDVLGGWGAQRAPSLDVVCRVAGITSPKSGLTGAGVQKAWNEGRILEIARYCLRDVVATAEAVDRWDATVGKVFGGPRK